MSRQCITFGICQFHRYYRNVFYLLVATFRKQSVNDRLLYRYLFLFVHFLTIKFIISSFCCSRYKNTRYKSKLFCNLTAKPCLLVHLDLQNGRFNSCPFNIYSHHLILFRFQT